MTALRPRSTVQPTVWGLCIALLLALVAGHARAATTPPGATPDGEGLALSLQTRDSVQLFALVIGSNATLATGQAPLRFADDDAVNMALLLEELGADVELVTALDHDTQALYPDMIPRARRPVLSEVMSAHKALVERMYQARRADPRPVELLIYYSGHGDVGPDGQGYLTLQGGKLTRHHLFSTLLGKSPADFNHLVVDACRSEEFVLSRGRDWKPDRAGSAHAQSVRRYLDENHLGSFPNTGVILATSADQQTHEWERYRGGVFSHELRSGLRGGADLNGDGRIEYSELGAFVSAANSGVQDPRARLEVVVRPPASDERRPFVRHEAIGDRRVLYFSQGDGHHYVVENEKGVRLADLRRSSEGPGYLRLPAGDVFVYRNGTAAAGKGATTEESRIKKETKGRIAVDALAFRDVERASRGALDQAFRKGLFAVPYGAGYYTGYTDQNGLLGVSDPAWEVTVWHESDGERVQLSPPPPKPLAADAKASESDDCDDCDDDWDDWADFWGRREVWGTVTVGTIFTPFSPEGQIRLGGKRVVANQMDPWVGPLRGLDVRWQMFTLRRNKRYPRALWYFRTGYTQGAAQFSPEDPAVGFEDGNATSLDYLTVPLFFGGNVYFFQEFPVRPHVGLGFGFDILRVAYQRANAGDLEDVSARIGFELHAGLEIRITNYVVLVGEVMQLWSPRRKLGGVPDFSNESFTIFTNIGASFPLKRRNERHRRKVERKKRKRAEAEARRKRERDEERARRAQETAPVRVEVEQGGEKVIVETRPGSEGGTDPEAPAASKPEPAPAAPDAGDAPDAPADGSSAPSAPEAGPQTGTAPAPEAPSTSPQGPPTAPSAPR